MNISRIEIENYRNIEKMELIPSPGVNIIYGDNAQGKTNLVESLWLFTGAKSFRAAKDVNLIRFGADAARLSLSFQREGRDQCASILLPRKGKKRVQLNYVELSGQTSLAGELYAVVFSPAHLSLVEDGPELRRRFLDTAICQLMPRYIDILGRYSRVLRQRNVLLRELRQAGPHTPPPPGAQDMLEVFDDALARLSASVIRARRKYISRLETAAEQIYSGISSRSESLRLEYRQGIGEEPPEPQAILEQLRRGRAADISAAATLTGPHRDDLALFIDQNDARIFGSQGQKRSCVLSLKLAESIIIEESSGQRPVILLDDVMSELDASRRDYLLNSLEGKQVFITCCDTGCFSAMKSGKCFHIAGGALEEKPLEAEKEER